MPTDATGGRITDAGVRPPPVGNAVSNADPYSADAKAGPAALATPPMRAAECLRLLSHARETALGPQETGDLAELGAPAAQAQHEARCALLSEKRTLGSAMEELRATMRSVQEDIERYVTETSVFTAQQSAAGAKNSTARDELEKVQGQLQRARQQSAEHMRSRVRMQQELPRCASVFQKLLDQESEAHGAVQHEVGQLQQVVRDLESRLRTKAGEIEQLKRDDIQTGEELAAAVESWRSAREFCSADLEGGPFGHCTEILARVATGAKGPEDPRDFSRVEQSQPANNQEGTAAVEVGEGDAVIAVIDAFAQESKLGEDASSSVNVQVPTAARPDLDNSQATSEPGHAEVS